MLQQVVEDWKGTALFILPPSEVCILEPAHSTRAYKSSRLFTMPCCGKAPKRGDVHCIGVQTHAKLNMYHEHVSIHCAGIHWMFLKARV